MMKTVCARILAAFAILTCAAFPARALPEVAVGTGYAVTPAEAWTYYQAQGVTSPAWSEDPDIDKLAAALGNDTDRIYEYVRNEIDVIPLFGVHAGARGALIDKAGTPFDQAQLMVELLRSAGQTATYQLGTITLTGTQFDQWFGLTNPTAVRKLLADGGTPATVTDNGTTVTSVTMMHVWVLTSIGGTTYAFDPAFKAHTVTAGIDVGATMGFNAATFWSNAITGASTATTNGTPRVTALNRTGVRTNLNTYATTLLNHIKTNLPNAAIENIIGGRTLVPYAGGPLRQASLPYQASLTTTFAGDLPLSMRTRVTLSFGASEIVNWVLDDIYGKQIVFVPNQWNPQPPTPSTYTLMLGNDVVGSPYTGVVGGGTVAINNPYASGTAAGVVNGAYMDRTVFMGNATVSGAMQVVIASGRPSSDLAAWQERTHTGTEGVTIFDFTTPASEEPVHTAVPAQIATRRRVGTGFLVQFGEMIDLLGGVSNAKILVHDIVGAVSVVPTYQSGLGSALGPVGSSFVITMEPAISPVSKVGDATLRDPVARAAAMMTSALEGATTQSITNSVYPVSAVAQLDWGQFGPAAADRWYYHVTAANFAWVQTQLLANYEGTSMAGWVQSYVDAGYTVFVPRSANLGPAPAQLQPKTSIDNPVAPVTHPDRAGALIAIHPVTGAVAHLSTRTYVVGKGGGGSADVEVNPSRIFSIGEDFLDKQYSARANAGSVDLKNGTLTYTPPADITVGNGGYPYSLSFQRSFRSGVHNSDAEADFIQGATGQGSVPPRTRDPDFGSSGWTSSFHHYANVSTSGEQVFGRDDPRVAAQTLAVAKVLSASLQNGATNLEMLQRQIVGAYAAFWWTETFTENTLTVNQGHGSRSFTKLHDGTFVARGSAETAELLGTRVTVTPSWGPSLFWYRHCARITGAQREISYYGIWDGTFTSCLGDASPNNAGGQTPQGEMMFARQVFPFGITVSWNGTTRTLSNNLGRSISRQLISGIQYCDVAGNRCVGIGTQGDQYQTTDAVGNVWRTDTTGGRFKAFAPTAPTVPMVDYGYDPGAPGAVATVKDAAGNTTQYTITAGRAAAVTDALGNTSFSLHDRNGNLVKTIDPLGRVSLTEYDNYRRKSKATAPEGNFTTWTYDAKSNVLSTTMTPKPGSPLAVKTTSATYNALCNLAVTETDELSRVTTTALNTTTCKATSVTQPAVGGVSPVTSYTYNGFGQVLTKTDPTGLVTQTTYHATNGNVLSVILNPGTAPNIAATTTFAYDTAANVIQITDPRGFVHTATYDAMRRLTQYNGPTSTNTKTKWTYDADGLIVKIERAANAAATVWTSTDYTYWPTARVRTMSDADGRVTRYSYDALNRLSVATDPENRQTKKVYDAAGQTIEERRAVGTPQEQVYATYSYTLNGKQAWIKDAKNNQTTYAYDGFDRLSRTTFPDATFEDLAYDAVSNVTSKLTRGGQLIQHTYDTLNRMATRLVPQPSPTPAILTTFTYDLAGRTTVVSDNAGHSLTNGFDTAKRIVSVTQAAPNFAGTRVISYQLDASSNKTRVTYPGGFYVQYAFDAMNRMTTATENGTFLLATYVWDTLSRRTSLVYGNGASQGYTYSNANDMLTLAHTLTGTSNTYTNTFTKAHQIESETASNAAWQYLPAVFQTTAYAAANPLNQYTNITVGANPTQTLGYDANGNLTSDGTLTFAYDAQNMLRTANKSGMAATYAYDPLGRRQAKTVNAVVTTFLSDGDEEIAEYDGANALLRRYVTGPGTDMPIAMVTAAGVRSYFHANRQGSVIAMSAANGTIAEGTYTYDAYGNGAPTTGVPFKYTGRRLDPETGLYYYRARYYAPTIGRFLQTDPVGYGDDMNLYGYVGNDPLNSTDPTGKLSFDDAIMAFGKAVDATIDSAVKDPVGTALDFVPIVGDIKGAVEFLEEPTVLGGIAVVASVVPVGGDAVAKILRGADKAADVVKAGEKATAKAAEATKAASASSQVTGTTNRVKLRKEVRAEIERNQPRNAKGQMIDPNTKEPLKPGKIDTGHKPGQEWRTRKQAHEDAGSTRKEVIETENDASLYHLEDQSSNRSHKNEHK